MKSMVTKELTYEVGEWIANDINNNSYKVTRDDGYEDFVDQGKWKNEKDINT